MKRLRSLTPSSVPGVRPLLKHSSFQSETSVIARSWYARSSLLHRTAVSTCACSSRCAAHLATSKPVPCTLYPVPCTLYPVPCPLYPIPCTRSPVPDRRTPRTAPVAIAVTRCGRGGARGRNLFHQRVELRLDRGGEAVGLRDPLQQRVPERLASPLAHRTGGLMHAGGEGETDRGEGALPLAALIRLPRARGAHADAPPPSAWLACSSTSHTASPADPASAADPVPRGPRPARPGPPAGTPAPNPTRRHSTPAHPAPTPTTRRGEEEDPNVNMAPESLAERLSRLKQRQQQLSAPPPHTPQPPAVWSRRPGPYT